MEFSCRESLRPDYPYGETGERGKNAAYFSFKWQKSKKIIAFRPIQRNFVLKLPAKMAYNLEML